MKIFLDSSTFAKRFVDEPESQKVEDLCSQAMELGLSVICVPEIMSALNLRGCPKHRCSSAGKDFSISTANQIPGPV